MSRKTIVLVHPFPLSSTFWSNFTPITGYQVLTPDFPGFGLEPVVGQGYTLIQAAQDLKRQLEVKNIPNPIVLAGISMGGYWAFEFVRQLPEQVEKLVLISTRAGIDKPEGRQNRLNMAERVEKEGIGFLPDAMIKGLVGKTSLADKPEVVSQVRQWIGQAAPQGVALAQRAMADRRDQSDFLPLIKAKTLIVAGQEDALIPPNEAVAMNRVIPGSELQLMNQVGHLLPVEDPKNFQKLFEAFLVS